MVQVHGLFLHILMFCAAYTYSLRCSNKLRIVNCNDGCAMRVSYSGVSAFSSHRTNAGCLYDVVDSLNYHSNEESFRFDKFPTVEFEDDYKCYDYSVGSDVEIMCYCFSDGCNSERAIRHLLAKTTADAQHKHNNPDYYDGDELYLD